MEGNPAKVSRATTQPTTDQRCMRGPKQDQSIPNQTSRAIWLSHCLLRKHGFFFFKTRTPFFISSFLAFEVLLDDILGLRFFAIVLNHQTTATKPLYGVFPLCQCYRGLPTPLVSCCPQLYVFSVAQSCPVLCDLMNCSLTGSSVHGIFQTRLLEWVAIFFSSHQH